MSDALEVKYDVEGGIWASMRSYIATTTLTNAS